MNGDHSLISQIKQGIYDMCHIWAKEMRSVFADEGVLLFFIFLPLFYPVLYSWIYNNAESGFPSPSTQPAPTGV